jgi:hypothetical protein
MANTGYIINPSASQFYITGPLSGSNVNTGSDVNLSTAPFSASLNNETYYNRAFDPDNCPEGFSTCLIPLLTSVNTGSQRGRFELSYVTQSSTNSPTSITASISNDINFSITEVFSSSIDSLIPISSSFISGTVYFRAFTSCSGPDQSPNSELISFTYDLIPPPNVPGTTNITFKNNFSSAMQVEIRSLRGNSNYIIGPNSSVTYDYTTSTGRSKDLNVTIKGGANNPLGNFIQRVTEGINEVTYTTGGGFDNPTTERENSNTFAADRGLSFIVRQLALPEEGSTTTTTFTLLETEVEVVSVFGTTPFPTENSACVNNNVNYREKHYYKIRDILYDNLADAQAGVRTNFPYQSNYIIVSRGNYIKVNKNGRIIEETSCTYPTIDLYTVEGSFATAEEACSRTKTSVGSTTFQERNVTLISGRYPVYDGSNKKGGRNVIINNNSIIAIETCGSELSPVLYGENSYPNTAYPLSTASLLSPETIASICNDTAVQTFYQGQSDTIYYGFDGDQAYIPLGKNSWRYIDGGGFALFNSGSIIETTDPC